MNLVDKIKILIYDKLVLLISELFDNNNLAESYEKTHWDLTTFM